jgi:hypothetical protein
LVELAVSAFRRLVFGMNEDGYLLVKKLHFCCAGCHVALAFRQLLLNFRFLPFGELRCGHGLVAVALSRDHAFDEHHVDTGDHHRRCFVGRDGLELLVELLRVLDDLGDAQLLRQAYEVIRRPRFHGVDRVVTSAERDDHGVHDVGRRAAAIDGVFQHGCDLGRVCRYLFGTRRVERQRQLLGRFRRLFEVLLEGKELGALADFLEVLLELGAFHLLLQGGNIVLQESALFERVVALRHYFFCGRRERVKLRPDLFYVGSDGFVQPVGDLDDVEVRGLLKQMSGVHWAVDEPSLGEVDGPFAVLQERIFVQLSRRRVEPEEGSVIRLETANRQDVTGFVCRVMRHVSDAVVHDRRDAERLVALRMKLNAADARVDREDVHCGHRIIDGYRRDHEVDIARRLWAAATAKLLSSAVSVAVVMLWPLVLTVAALLPLVDASSRRRSICCPGVALVLEWPFISGTVSLMEVVTRPLRSALVVTLIVVLPLRG